MSKPLVSLILCTLNRKEEVIRFLESLNNQTYKKFEVIIVDQNEDDRIDKIVDNFKYKIKLLKSERGLSLSRNKGLENSIGDIVAFPDDDCWYHADTIKKVVDVLSDKSICGVSCRIKDSSELDSVINWPNEDNVVNVGNCLNCCCSASLFLSKSIVEKVGCFNVDLGLGAKTGYGSGEETDLVLKILKINGKIIYKHKLYLYHPQQVTSYNEKSQKRAYSYGLGMGRTLSLNNYPILKTMFIIIKPLVATCLFIFDTNKRKFYFNSFRGRFKGYFCT